MPNEQIQHLPLDKVQAVKQVRSEFSDETQHGLLQSIEQVGLLFPIRVRREGERFPIVDGDAGFERSARSSGSPSLPSLRKSPSRKAR